MSDYGMIYDDLYEICKDRELLFEFCQNERLIGNFTGDPCPEKNCNGHLSLRKDNSKVHDKAIYRCTKNNCSFKRSIRYKSWFSGSKLSIGTILKITYYWVYKLPSNFIKRELRIGQTLP